ncbi:MAG: peptide deformylase [bacterium]|nr:peptide deformylase [bacterium]
MALREIVKTDNPILRKKAVKVTSFDARFQQLVDDMVETMLDAPGVGLAAPQVGVSQRLIVVRLPDDEESREEYGDLAGVLYVVANPKIIKSSKKLVDGVEACLSIPGYYGEVARHEEVVITGQDRQGKEIRIKAKDWLARVFQHEIDHLDGQLYIDIAKDVWKAKDEEENAETSAQPE